MARNKKQPKRITTRPKRQEKSPFLEHIHEFRRRLIWVALVVVIFSVVGYAINESLINFLLNPAKNQQFIYTTPGGGLNFIIQISIYFGIIVGIPVIIYHLLRYLEPLLSQYDRGFVMKCAFLSASLALGGMAFGYFIGLPAALTFLSDQFQNDRITALLTLNDYLSFVTIYMLGSALMFQIPVVLVFANRIKPLSAKKLATSQRWVIITAFIAAAIITPTPDLFNQCIIAIPIIAVYQLGVLLVASQNRYSKVLVANRLRGADRERWEKRQQTAAIAVPLLAAEPLPETAEDTEVPPLPQNGEDTRFITTIQPDNTPAPAKPTPVRTIAIIADDETTEVAKPQHNNTASPVTAKNTTPTRRISVAQLE